MDSSSLNHNFDLYIEELVLQGFSDRDVYRITSAMQTELEQLFNRGSLSSGIQNRNITRIEGSTVQVQSGATPETAGRQIRASYDSWQRQICRHIQQGHRMGKLQLR